MQCTPTTSPTPTSARCAPRQPPTQRQRTRSNDGQAKQRAPASCPSGALPGDRKLLQPVNDAAFHAFQFRSGSQGEARQAGQQRLQGDPGLKPCQRGTQAKVDAMAEGQVPVGAAVDVELSGRRELCPSRLAEPIHATIGAPAGTLWPLRTVSATATRYMDWTGDRKRRTSSSAWGSRPGSSRSRPSVPGDSARHKTALPIRLVVVSLPATSRRLQKPSSSGTVSRCPPISADSRLLIRSVPGLLRRRSIRARKYSTISDVVVSWVSPAGAVRVWLTMTSDQCLKRSRSSAGMPNSSEITMTGNG